MTPLAATFLGWAAPTFLALVFVLFPGWISGRRRK